MDKRISTFCGVSNKFYFLTSKDATDVHKHNTLEEKEIETFLKHITVISSRQWLEFTAHAKRSIGEFKRSIVSEKIFEQIYFRGCFHNIYTI